ncbi:lamin tail domain-containing protein [Candidatus Shapirobacteria bacterium]|nr:lamin tail domain-containing protein [Candidatus Shapirobacteria bacterium]
MVFNNENIVGKKRIFFLLSGAAIFFFLAKEVLAINFGDVVINEVMWMGTAASFSDEWIELFNLTDKEISLSGWILAAEDNTPYINLEGKIGPQAFFLLERSDDQTVSNVPADQIYTGDLNNNGEHLFLFLKNDQSQVIIDELNASRGWPAGSNDLKASMARQSDGGWLTSDVGQGKDANGDFINGTPREANRFLPTPTLTPPPTLIISPSPAPSAPTPTTPITATSVLSPTKVPTPSLASAKATYQINEVRNEKGEALSSVKIYVDDQYIHHYAPEVLEFCDACFCDSEKKVACGFGEHTIRLEKNGYQDWEEEKTIEVGNSYLVNPVMIFPFLTLTPTAVSMLTPSSKAEKEENLLPTITSLLSPNFSPSPFLFLNNFSLLPKKLVGKEEEIANVNEAGQVLGEQEEKEKQTPDWYFVVGAFYLGTSGWRLSRKSGDDIMEKLDFKEEK